MSADNEKNILYGGPEPALIDGEAKSFGEVILRKLAVNGNDVMFVSIKKLFERVKEKLICFYFVTQLFQKQKTVLLSSSH